MKDKGVYGLEQKRITENTARLPGPVTDLPRQRREGDHSRAAHHKASGAQLARQQAAATSDI